MISKLSRAAGIALAVVLGLPAAQAATSNGAVEGRVTDQATGKPLPGITVTVSGPALQGEQTEFTDSNGHYIITELPPGEYMVRFYFSNVKVERPGVIVNADRTLSVNAAMPTAKAETQTFRITERAPTVDVANTQVQTSVTDELVKNAPIRGRTYESVLTLAPGAATDAVGFSFNGATGPENAFIIDGLNTTNPSHGLIGTPLTLEFIKETEIITGGYNAEYGRATGGVINVVTKSGSNEFHGGAWFNYAPLMLEPKRIARLGEAVASIRYGATGGLADRAYKNAFDFGFDLGGPILKDRIWFYAGFAPSFVNQHYDRILRSRVADNDAEAMAGGKVDKSISCPEWLKAQNPVLCSPSMQGVAALTVDLPEKYWTHFDSQSRLYNLIGKLTFRINDNNNLTLSYIGSPSTFTGYLDDPRDPQSLGVGFNGNMTTAQFIEDAQVHDAMLHFVSKLLERRLQIDVFGGFHYEHLDTKPNAEGNKRGSATDQRTVSLTLFEPEVDPCDPTKGTNSNWKSMAGMPCPVSNYRDGGFGFIHELTSKRAVAALSLTYFARLLGTHALKLGGDFEDVFYSDHRGYTGGANGGRYRIRTTGCPNGTGCGAVQRTQFGTVVKDAMGNETVLLTGSDDPAKNGYTADTQTLNYSVYLRDSWNVGFLPGLTINAGLRWEAQQVKDVTGATQIGIYDNIAPRVGFVYDFTGKGRSKLYASYGRFYESIPLDINDRQFSSEGLAIQTVRPTFMGGMQNLSQCMNSGNPGPGAGTVGRVDVATCKFPDPTRPQLNGGEFGAVSPSIKGQYSNEVVAGFQYDVGLDLVLGAAYIHRDLARVIEDISPDGGTNYIIGNPGEPTDKGTVDDLTRQIDANNKARANAMGDDKVKLDDEHDKLTNKLRLYKAVEGFEKPKRDYNALVLTATKRLSHNFILLASYTYSRTIGNYPGLYSPSNGQLDPNISSQYDLKELLANRNGPLPNDRPHNLKVTGAYYIPLGGAGALTVGLNLNVLSGAPIEVLGFHPTYGPNETFILPRGSGGRMPTLTTLDLHLGWSRTFGKNLRADITADVFNVLNQQNPTDVDMQYTADSVNPIPNGTYEQLKILRTTDGSAPHLNPNYGTPTQFQAPLSLRFGARVAF